MTDPTIIGTFDGEILVALKEDEHSPTSGYVAALRKRLPQLFPSLLFYFQPADIVTQILNFGLPAPIDIQVAGFDPKNYDIARHIRERIAGIPGIVDSHVHQVVDGPDLHYEIDRARAVQFGLTAQDVSNSMNISLSSSTQVQPNFYLDPRMGITYFVAAQTPQDRLRSVADVGNTPVSVRNSNEPQLLSNLASVTHAVQPVNVNHRNVQPVFDVYANVQDADLGSVADHIDTVVKDFRKQLAPGSEIFVRYGQVDSSVRSAFFAAGIRTRCRGFARLPAHGRELPELERSVHHHHGTARGLRRCRLGPLFLTQSTFSVPSLMGAIMSIGVATANSILLVTFAAERMELGRSSLEAAIDAGCTRLRPIFMTAMAMVIGMFPMALGLGEGGEQNAPLARAVIGGLVVATAATLFFVPLMFTILRKAEPRKEETIA